MNKTLTCFILDDEPDDRVLIRKYIEQVPFLELVGETGDPISALFHVSDSRPDLLFLDVEMPQMNGFEFIRSLHGHRPRIILVAASPSYALEGYDYHVVDYLLKPVPFERFIRGAYRAASLQKIVSKAETLPAVSAPRTYLMIRENKKTTRINFEDIELVEAAGDYVKIHQPQKMEITYSTLTKIEAQLSQALFMRVSRSCIIQKNAVSQIVGNQIITKNGKTVAIGVTYRDKVFEALYLKKNG